MGISRFFNLLLGCMAVLIIAIFGNSIAKTITYNAEVKALASLAEGRTAWSRGTVALSLERSVTQVALALEEPIPSDFRGIIDAQRDASDLNLNQTTKQVLAEFQHLPGSPSFLEDVASLRADISELRREVDVMLSRPLDARDATRVSELPTQLKARISELQTLSKRLRFESTAISDDTIALETLQNLAWEIREYGGRARNGPRSTAFC